MTGSAGFIGANLVMRLLRTPDQAGGDVKGVGGDGNARPENFPDVNDYRNPVIAEALRVMGYVNKFNRGIARVQKELVENGNGKAAFTVDKVTVFSVNVTNAKADNVSAGVDTTLDVKELVLSDKSLKVLVLCAAGSRTKKEMLQMVGVTNQTVNVRSIINPLIQAGCLAPIEEDQSKSRNVRYAATARGLEYLRQQQSISHEDTTPINEQEDDSEPLLFPDFK